jgi:cytochrome c
LRCDPSVSRRRLAEEDLEISFNDHCRECHSFLKGDNRLGPTLYGVVGRKAGEEPGYGYTQSLKDSGVTWDAATLDKWIADPGAVIPGNGRPTAALRIRRYASASLRS